MPSPCSFFNLTSNWWRSWGLEWEKGDRLIIVLTSERHFQETAKRRNQRLTQSPRACYSLSTHVPTSTPTPALCLYVTVNARRTLFCDLYSQQLRSLSICFPKITQFPAHDVGNSAERLTLRRLMSYIYGAPILDVSRSHTTTQHSR